MARWDYRYLGAERFPATLSALEIEHFFTLEAAELAAARRRRGPMNRLAVALQIGFIKMTGTPLNSVQLIPAAVMDHAARQIGSGEGTPLIASIRALYRRRRTLFDHQQAALDVLGFRHLHEHAEPGLIASVRHAAADRLLQHQAPWTGTAPNGTNYGIGEAQYRARQDESDWGDAHPG